MEQQDSKGGRDVLSKYAILTIFFSLAASDDTVNFAIPCNEGL